MLPLDPAVNYSPIISYQLEGAKFNYLRSGGLPQELFKHRHASVPPPVVQIGRRERRHAWKKQLKISRKASPVSSDSD